MKKYRVCVVGDHHAGHMAGLTPPSFWRNDLQWIQQPFWEWFKEEMSFMEPFDGVFHVGDAVDGPGKKENHEHLTTDMSLQQEIAIETLKAIPVKRGKAPGGGSRWLFTLGSPYHVTGKEEWEDEVADAFNSDTLEEPTCRIWDWKIHLRHVVGGSSTAEGPVRQIKTELVRCRLRSGLTEGYTPNFVIRGHLHQFHQVRDRMGIGMINPGLKLPGEVYGRNIRGVYYDVGFTELVFREDGFVEIWPHLMPLRMYWNWEFQGWTKEEENERIERS